LVGAVVDDAPVADVAVELVPSPDFDASAVVLVAVPALSPSSPPHATATNPKVRPIATAANRAVLICNPPSGTYPEPPRTLPKRGSGFRAGTPRFTYKAAPRRRVISDGFTVDQVSDFMKMMSSFLNR
jgi:hypothetical protein